MSSFRPSLDTVRDALSKAEAGHTIVPVYRELMADLETPVSVFQKVRGLGETNHAFLLESIKGGEKLERYSFIGTNPKEVISIGDGEALKGDPLTHIQPKLDAHKLLDIPESKLPSFTGGYIGYVSYDCVRHFEPRTAPAIDKQKDVMGIPEARFMYCDGVIIFDHATQTIKVVAQCNLTTGDVEAEYAKACASIASVCDALSTPLATPTAPAPVMSAPPTKPSESGSGSGSGAGAGAGASGDDAAAFTDPSDGHIDWEKSSNVGQDGYKRFVRTLKTHVVGGDIIQAVPSQRLAQPLLDGVTPFDVYRQLRRVNPSPYMFYLDLGDDFQIVGASPEMLAKVEEGIVYTHPIAGTRRRGKTPAQDAALAEDLLSDEKERAEHLMLVDLGRNDVGRVSTPGTVKVDSLMHIEMYSHVMHIVSIVRGELAKDKTMYDAFRSIFPAGTVSGAPKIRAIELVAGLEEERRHIYAGAVGYFGFGDSMDSAIAIRTIVVRNNVAYIQAGGGIVYDSDPAVEYQETVNKLGGTAKALQQAAAMAKAMAPETPSATKKART